MSVTAKVDMEFNENTQKWEIDMTKEELSLKQLEKTIRSNDEYFTKQLQMQEITIDRLVKYLNIEWDLTIQNYKKRETK